MAIFPPNAFVVVAVIVAWLSTVQILFYYEITLKLMLYTPAAGFRILGISIRTGVKAGIALKFLI